MALEHEDLTGSIIGAAIAVHRELGPGFLEAVYDHALALELRARRIPCERQLCVPVAYRRVEVGSHRLDLFVAKQVVVELKAVKEIAAVHFAVVRSYLRAVDKTHGLILNFAKATLGVKRAIVQRAPSCTSCVP
jgi:GxxExxY protein